MSTHPVDGAASVAAVLQGLDFAVPCDSPLHDDGAAGHVPEQGARYIVDVRCLGCGGSSRRLLCAGHVTFGLAYGREGGRFRCERCGHEASVLGFWHAIQPLEDGVLR